MSNLLGQTLGRYHILEQLGEGGMAIVYKAYDTRLETDVAVKVIRIENLAPSILEKSLKRFEREAKSLARLTHPNIVKVIDYGEHEGKPYLVMTYLPGGTLKERLKNGALPWRGAVQLISPIARALDYAHKQNLIHRDVKPSNILMTDSGQPMLTDFGVAKLFDLDESTALTGTGMGIGTPEYMAPEQWTGQSTPQTDVYALGLVLYEMVTGRKPYAADTPAALFLKQANDPLPRPKSLMPSLPDAVEKVLLKALAKRSEDRYPDMEAFSAALDKLSMDKEPVTVGETMTRADTFRTTSTVMEEIRREAPPTSKRSDKRMAWVAAAGILFACCVVVVAGVFVWRLMSPTATPAVEVPQITVAPVEAITDIPANPLPNPGITDVPQAPVPNPVITDAPVVPDTPTELSVDGAELVFIPAGEFLMGSDTGTSNAFCRENNSSCDGFADASPQHSVYLDAYSIDKFEVTNAMFEKFVSAKNYRTEAEKTGYGEVWRGNGSVINDAQQVSGADWRHPAGPGSSISGLENHPVVQVSWRDAKAYCQWAGRRLPTEAEWEKAAHGNSASYFPWGSGFNCQFGNYDDEQYVDSFILEGGRANCDGFARTAPVGSFPQGQSPYGAFDMSGNVWEWVADWYDKSFYSYSPSANPLGPSDGTIKVYRGGSWFSEMKYLYVPYRQANPPSYHDDITGFRCAVSQ
jgi:formylglycine-generating enzyme required for sulfatase activity/tRNA A-37 threonylcarbamoyl transferase component Bud32